MILKLVCGLIIIQGLFTGGEGQLSASEKALLDQIGLAGLIGLLGIIITYYALGIYLLVSGLKDLKKYLS